MKSKWRTIVKRSGLVLTGPLVIGVAAALMVFGIAADVSASERPSVRASYQGWAADATNLTERQTRDLARRYDYTFAIGTPWNCGYLRCHYVRVEWSGIEPEDDLWKVDGVNDGPGWHLYVFPKDRSIPGLSKTVGVEEADGGDGSYVYYAAVPWAGEQVVFAIQGDRQERIHSSRARIPAHVPPGFKTKTDRAGVTLVNWADAPDTDLPVLLSVFPKVDDATEYEVRYAFRHGLNRGKRYVSRVTHTALSSPRRVSYESLGANWDHHKRSAVLNGLTNEDFEGEDAGWIFTLTTLPQLVAGAPGWPRDERSIDDEDITKAMDRVRGKSSVGIQVRPMLACSAYPGADRTNSEFCSPGSSYLKTLPLPGKRSKASFVKFTSDDLEREGS